MGTPWPRIVTSARLGGAFNFIPSAFNSALQTNALDCGNSPDGCYSPRVKTAPFVRSLLVAVAAVCVTNAATPPATGLAALRVPEGFRVELAAGPDLAPYAMFGALDERGRLFLAESSGKNIKGAAMAYAPECRIRLLVDSDGDGFDDFTEVKYHTDPMDHRSNPAHYFEAKGKNCIIFFTTNTTAHSR